MIIINIGHAKVHPPVRSRAELCDAAEIGKFLDSAYGVRMRLEESGPHSASLTHARVDIGAVAVDDIELPGEVHAEPDPLNKVVTVWAHDGKVSSQCGGLSGEAVKGEVTVLAQPDLPYSAHFVDMNSTTMLLDADLVADVAGASTDGQAPVIRFSSFRPADEAVARLWTDTVSYVKHCVLADDNAATPLVLGHCSRLLAAVTLSTFPNTIIPEPRSSDRTDSGPALLRRASIIGRSDKGSWDMRFSPRVYASKRIAQRLIRCFRARNAHAFVVAQQMWRCVAAYPITGTGKH